MSISTSSSILDTFQTYFLCFRLLNTVKPIPFPLDYSHFWRVVAIGSCTLIHQHSKQLSEITETGKNVDKYLLTG